MNSRAALLAGLFASVMATVACEDVNQVPVTPVGPSSLSNVLLPRLDGNWGGELTLSGVSGGTGPAVNAGVAWCDGASFALYADCPWRNIQHLNSLRHVFVAGEQIC